MTKHHNQYHKSKRTSSADPEPDPIVVDPYHLVYAVKSKELDDDLETVELYGGERGV